MIEVTFFMSNISGDGPMSFLVETKTDTLDPRQYFDVTRFAQAVRRALTALESDPVLKRSTITRIDIRTTPDKVLLLEP